MAYYVNQCSVNCVRCQLWDRQCSDWRLVSKADIYDNICYFVSEDSKRTRSISLVPMQPPLMFSECIINFTGRICFTNYPWSARYKEQWLNWPPCINLLSLHHIPCHLWCLWIRTKCATLSPASAKLQQPFIGAWGACGQSYHSLFCQGLAKSVALLHDSGWSPEVFFLCYLEPLKSSHIFFSTDD